MSATQAAQLRDWAAAFGQPQVLMGAFNSTSGAPELQPLFGAYHDAWTDAAQAGRAIGSGISHGTSTIDFILYQPGTSLTVQSVQVVDTAALVGVEASDHRPVVATVTVR